MAILYSYEVTGPYLQDMDSRVSEALASAGYLEKSYYALPDGFAIATRLEQINPDGTPKVDPERWNIDVGTFGSFSLNTYIKALFTANAGYYRVIAFLITPHPISQRGRSVSRKEAVSWISEGLTKLPKAIGKRKYSKEYTVTVLIYEFEQPSYAGEALIRLPGRLSGKRHLRKARIFAFRELR